MYLHWVPNFKNNFFKIFFINKVSNFCDISETSLAKQIFLNFHCCFFTRITRMSLNMSKLHHNFQNAKNYLNSLGYDEIKIHLGVNLPTKSCWTFLDNSLFLCVTETSIRVFLDSFFNPSYLWHTLTFWLLSFGETCLLTVSTYSFE